MLVRASFSRAARLLLTTLLVPAQLLAQTSPRAASAPSVPSESNAPEAGPDIVPPEPVSTPLAYPESASGAATVELELTIDATGQVVDVRAVFGDEPFRSAALSAAQGWLFEPARRRGRAVAARIRYSAEFRPEPAQAVAPSEPTAGAPGAATRERPPPSGPMTEILVQGQRAPSGSVVLTRQETRSLPGAFGDPLRAIEAQPGVVPIVSGLPQFFIRGAPPANVGFFFDGIELPLLYHAYFGPSVVHPGFIDSIDFYPGSSPAQFGRFAGPIVAVNSSPLASRPTGEANLRIIDAGGMIESGPLHDCRAPSGSSCSGGGARAAGRYSYAGLVLSLLSDAKLNYWDYQAQASYPLSQRDDLSILAFGGYDLFREPQASVNTGVELTFHRVDLRWDRRFGSDGALRVALTGGYDRAAGSDTPSRSCGTAQCACALSSRAGSPAMPRCTLAPTRASITLTSTRTRETSTTWTTRNYSRRERTASRVATCPSSSNRCAAST